MRACMMRQPSQNAADQRTSLRQSNQLMSGKLTRLSLKMRASMRDSHFARLGQTREARGEVAETGLFICFALLNSISKDPQ
jgi:hypothetical protein